MRKPVTLTIGGTRVYSKKPSGSYAKKRKRAVTKPVVKKMIAAAINEVVEFREFDATQQGELVLPVLDTFLVT